MTDAATQKTKQPVILCVDDEPNVLKSLKRSLHSVAAAVHTCTSGQEALSLLEEQHCEIDLLISDMRMPHMSGHELLQQAATHWPSIGRVLLTGYADLTSTIQAINEGKIFSYLQKPWNDQTLQQNVQHAWQYKRMSDERDRLFKLSQTQNRELTQLNQMLDKRVLERTQSLQQAVKELEMANVTLLNQHMSGIKMLMDLLELRLPTYRGYFQAVVDHALKMAEVLQLDDQTQETIYHAASIHDLGLMGLPDQLIDCSYSRLQSLDKQRFQQHSELGEHLLKNIPQLSDVAKLVRHHHEYFDGSGYPDKLRGDEIPIGSQIIGIASDYQQLISGHLLSRKLSPIEAQAFLVNKAGTQYSCELVRVFINILINESNTQAAACTSVNHQQTLPVADVVLAEDIYSKQGALLLSKGTRLNQQLLDKVRRAMI